MERPDGGRRSQRKGAAEREFGGAPPEWSPAGIARTVVPDMREHPLIVFTVLDAFPHQRLEPRDTPTLARLAEEGGQAPDGGRAVVAVGDQNLIHVCGATAADAHWPPKGELPEAPP